MASIPAEPSGRYRGGIGPDQNKALVRRFYAEAINGRDLDACDRLLTQDFVHDGEAWDEVDMLSVLQQLGALPQS